MIINIIYCISKMRRLVREDSGDLKLSIREKYAFELEKKKRNNERNRAIYVIFKNK